MMFLFRDKSVSPRLLPYETLNVTGQQPKRFILDLLYGNYHFIFSFSPFSFADSGVTCNMVQPGNVDTKYGGIVKVRYIHTYQKCTLWKKGPGRFYTVLWKKDSSM